MITEVVKKEKEDAGLTTKELAEKSDIPVHRLYELEQGKRDFTVEELFKVDRALDNNVVWELVDRFKEG